jgi:hypothetical protein
MYKEIVLDVLNSCRHLTHNERLSKVFKNVISTEDGYCVEIGAGYGETTVKLLPQTKNFKVIVVDPFETGWDKMPESYGKPYPYTLFESAVKGFSNRLILIKKLSDDPTVLDELKNYSPIVFSFVDGLQYVENVLSDLKMMDELNCKIICVDDYNRLTKISEVPLAIEEFMKINQNYEMVYFKGDKEVYLVRNEKN